MNKKILLLLPALAMVLAGCNNKKKESSTPTSSASADAVTAVEVAPAEKTLEAGETVQLEATVKPFSVSNKDVTWSSDNEALATVNASGLVTTLEAGTVHIKATSQADTSKSGQSTLTITPAYVYYPEKTPDTAKTFKFGTYQQALSQRIFFNGEFEDYPRGKTVEGYENGVDVQFEDGPSTGKYYVKFTVGGATKYFGMGDNHRFGGFDSKSAETVWDWNSELRTISRTLTDTKTYFPGTYNNYTTISGCDITMASSDYIFQFLTKLEPVDPTSVNIVEATANVYANGNVQLHAECEPAGAMNAKLTWSVLDNEKVHVDNHGYVTADADAVVGSTATVKATFGTLEGDTCVVTVKEALNYGTLENPLNVAEAKALIDKFPAGDLTEQKLFVKGYVSADHGALSATVRNDVWLTNDDGSVEQEFELYSVYADSTLGEIAANGLIGKQVVATGWGKNYNGTYEFNAKDPQGEFDNGIIKAVSDGTRVATALEFTSEAFEIEQGGNKAVKAKPLPYGATATINYSVSPTDQGVTYEDGQVKATAGALAGDYTLTAAIQGTEITKNLSFKVTAPLAKKAAYDFEATAATGSEYSADGLKARIAASANTTSPLTDVITAVTATAKVFPSNNNDTKALGIKLGTGSVDGTFTFSTSINIKKVVVYACGWSGSDKTIKVGDADAVTMSSIYTDENAIKAYEFTITASNSIQIKCSHRGFIQALELYA